MTKIKKLTKVDDKTREEISLFKRNLKEMTDDQKIELFKKNLKEMKKAYKELPKNAPLKKELKRLLNFLQEVIDLIDKGIINDTDTPEIK